MHFALITPHYSSHLAMALPSDLNEVIPAKFSLVLFEVKESISVDSVDIFCDEM